MARGTGHRDRTYARWWLWLAVAFAVAVVIIFVLPFLSSPQPEQELQTAPTSITQGDFVNNQSEQSSAAEQSPSDEERDTIIRPQ
jgi:hypothetical protein